MIPPDPREVNRVGRRLLGETAADQETSGKRLWVAGSPFLLNWACAPEKALEFWQHGHAWLRNHSCYALDAAAVCLLHALQLLTIHSNAWARQFKLTSEATAAERAEFARLRSSLLADPIRLPMRVTLLTELLLSAVLGVCQAMRERKGGNGDQ